MTHKSIDPVNPEALYTQAAKEEWERDGEIEFDENPVVSISEDSTGEIGAYVAAWVWVPNPNAEDQS